MEPALNSAEPVAHRSYLELGKKGCVYLPLPLLGCTAIGGVGFALWTAFGTGTLVAASYANIVFDGMVVATSVFAGGCYYKNLPEKAFEENVKKQGSANIELQKIELQVNQSIDLLKDTNKELDLSLQGMDEKIKGLENALLQKGADLLDLSNELKETLVQLDKTKENFEIAQKTVDDAKVLVVSMGDLSKKMKSNIKSSKIALDLFKDENQDFEKENVEFDANNEKLLNLLANYTAIVSKEHEQFNLLIKACDKLDVTCKKLEDEITELSSTKDQIVSNVQKGINNTQHLEEIEKQLEKLTDDLKI